MNGIERDKDAVKNAIQFDYNNGLAEGSVNKLKVIKRIMYGRNSFELLILSYCGLNQRKSPNFGKNPFFYINSFLLIFMYRWQL